MAQTDEAVLEWITGNGRKPEQINALLFCRLAEFLVWGQQHTEISESYPEFDSLLFHAATALARGGVLDQPAELGGGENSLQIDPGDSEILASRASGGGGQG